MRRRNSQRRAAGSVALGSLVAMLAMGLAAGENRAGGSLEARAGLAGTGPPGVVDPAQTPESTWRRVDELVEQDRVAAALEIVEGILPAAMQSADEEEWTRALVRSVQLRTALQGYATAVRTLQRHPWPQGPPYRSVVHLFFSEGLINYLRAYSWEIAQRERMVADDELALERWTREQILAAAQESLLEVWRRRESWDEGGIDSLAEYVEQNNYPARIRGRLRDAVTYLWVELLSDTALWRPSHSSQLFRVDLATLLASDRERLSEASLIDPAVHPLVKIGVLLDDLEAWHRQHGRDEAAFEARLERARRLHAIFERDDDRALIRSDLEARLGRLEHRYEWWSMGQALLAELVQQDTSPGALVRARDLALAGERAHPGSIGGQRCRYLVAAIEAPEYSLAAMSSDGPGRRSIQVHHKNLERLHLRAYALNLREQLRASQDFELLPDFRQVPDVVSSQLPVAEWDVELPPTRDFRLHQTFVTPPLERSGLYLVVASARRDFQERFNRRMAVNLLVGDLVLLSRRGDTGVEVTVRSGSSGRVLPGVIVDLYRSDYRRGHRRLLSRTTDGDGTAAFPSRLGEREQYFLIARQGDEIALDSDRLWFPPATEPSERTSALIYTDRSVYRPQQRISWKVVAYRGGGEESRFETLPATHLTVELLDANREVVVAREVRTNLFGSAAGEFRIPGDRLLGSWQLRSSLGGTSVIRVEEYKRPTFEVSLLDPEGQLRLNRLAVLTGEARYYFGLPVVSGEVTWWVERVPLLPPWWYGRGFAVAEPEIVAGGGGGIDPQGRFRIEFLPAADERLGDSPEIRYRYRLSVDVTDEGGETRSASRVFRLGFVAVEAAVDSERGFYRAGEPIRLVVGRTDLDGVARAGSGVWRLIELVQPDRVVLPADLPVEPLPTDAERYLTAGDRLRPRWSRDYEPTEVLRQWSDGRELRRGELSHGESGDAELRLGRLPSGVYRVRYQTADDFGATFELAHEVIVAEPGRSSAALPALLRIERPSVPVGEVARILAHSGLPDQELLLEIFRGDRRVDLRRLSSEEADHVIELPITASDRGGLGVRLVALRDHQLIVLSDRVLVPWSDRELEVEFATFRDRLRPGSSETWRVQVSGAEGHALSSGSVELLAYMYDRSLDLFAPHQPPDPLGLYPERALVGPLQDSLGSSHPVWSSDLEFARLPDFPHLRGDRLKFFPAYGIGGPGRGGPIGTVAEALAAPRASTIALDAEPEPTADLETQEQPRAAAAPQVAGRPAELRTDFSETAFWRPHLVLGDDGGVAFEFTVPDSVTEWNVWVHALTRDLRAGALERRARSVKDLMVRPYLPRFLRQGDRADLRVVVNNAGETVLSGHLELDIIDPESEESLLTDFGLTATQGSGVPFSVPPGGGVALGFPIAVPNRLGTVGFRVVARSGDASDGELRPLPVLPGRLHLSQSRSVTLHEVDRRSLRFADMAAGDDPSLLHEQLVVTLDAQLFYGVLRALPYLVRYPYECTEQLLNRFLSTGILSALYDSYPAVARMARNLEQRQTRYETWDEVDPNRKMALEETPWLRVARGGEAQEDELIDILDPRIASAERRAALAKLEKSQTSLGGFPWWPGGPPSPHMTLYILYGFSKGLEFGIEVPREPVERAWQYLHGHYLDEMVRAMMADDCCWETVTFLNYVLSNYPDPSWTGDLFTARERRQMLDFSFRHWRRHSPLLKGYLALTLERAGRPDDARLVFDSVLDSARTGPDTGTFWAPEDRAWLWYNDTIETHAFILRALIELEPEDVRRHGLVQWLFLNKKLNHWKSTRATAEVVYALVHYLEREGSLGRREEITVAIGAQDHHLVFEPDEYVGSHNQIVVAGERVEPATMSTIEVAKQTPGFLFAAATWHFSTERLPADASGDFLSVDRSYFKRVNAGDEWILRPVGDGLLVEVGDQIEVHLSLRVRHAAEYVHLRDPRAAGYEPESTTSRYRWDLGIGWYEETRDSGTNFFFEWLPAGEYTFKYRLRAAVAGTFKVAPAVLQSMYAPEFTAYSAGALQEIRPSGSAAANGVAEARARGRVSTGQAPER